MPSDASIVEISRGQNIPAAKEAHHILKSVNFDVRNSSRSRSKFNHLHPTYK